MKSLYSPNMKEDRRYRGKNIIALTILSIALCSCSTLQQMQTTKLHYLTWQQRQQQLNKLKNWDLQCAFGIRQPSGSDIAHCNWQQRDKKYSLLISSPLNLISIKIIGQPNKVTIWKTQNKKITAQSPEALIYRQTGWLIPITNLKYWIVGLPAPNLTHKIKLDKYHHLTKLQQQGWQISYNYYRSINNIDLPTLIILTNKKLKIKLVIQKWQLY